MIRANKFTTAAFGALLALQAPQALGEQNRQLAEPFRVNVSDILQGEQGRLLKVNSIQEFAEKYQKGSSVVVEGNYGLSDTVLRDLQKYINENYSHLNILVYLAEYGGVSKSERDVCGSNDKLSVLREAFFNTVATGGEGQDVILYLAGTSLNDPERMLCALISPNMARLTGTDERIFSPGTPLFEGVVSQLRPDFNRPGAIKAFVRGIDAKIQKAQINIEQNKQAHIARVISLQNQLTGFTSGINQILGENISLDGSQIYEQFRSLYISIESNISGEAQYISEAMIFRVQEQMNKLDVRYNILLSAIIGLTTASKRVEELKAYSQKQSSSEHAESIASLNAELMFSIEQTQALIDAGNVDYSLSLANAEKLFGDIQTTLSNIKFREDAKKGGAGAAGIGFLGTLIYFNRRTRRKLSRKEFVEELEKLEVGLKETKKVFEEEISGNTESIEIFFGNQAGQTKDKIETLKKSVAYTSVLLPKIEEILQKAKKSIGISAVLRATPYEEALKIMSEDTHIIDPSQSEVDQRLLKKISGGNLQNFSELIQTISQTLPELIKLLDENIDTTKTIFSDLHDASDNMEQVKNTNTTLIQTLSQRMGALLGNLGEEFLFLGDMMQTLPTLISEVRNKGNTNDIIGEYDTLKKLNNYITKFIEAIEQINTYIVANTPQNILLTLRSAGYQTEGFLKDIKDRYTDFFTSFRQELEKRTFNSQDFPRFQTAILGFYQEMQELAEKHKNKLLAEERLIAQKIQVEESENSIKKRLGDRLKTGNIYQEEGYVLGNILGEIASLIQQLGANIQERERGAAQKTQSDIKESQDFVRDIIERTEYAVDNFDTHLGALESTRDNLSSQMEKIETQLNFLKKTFSAEILILRVSDFHAEGTDRDIGNNVSEIEGLLSQLSTYFAEAKNLFIGAKFIQAYKLLETIQTLLIAIEQRIQEVQGVHKNVTETHVKNPKYLEQLTERFDILKQKASQVHITPKSKVALDAIVYSLGAAQSTTLSGGNLPNPYMIEETLQEIEAHIQKTESEIKRDEAEYSEYLQYVELSQTVLGTLQKKATQAENDTLPDSKEALQIIASTNDIEKAHIRLSQYRDTQVQDWYALTDELEKVIRIGQQHHESLLQDDRERNEAKREVEDASTKIRQAKSWSGRYVSISSSIGESDMRGALQAYNEGNFSQAIQYANAAESRAASAISSAEDADRSEKRRREAAAEAAERSRRAAISRSTTSSSSFGGFSGGGGGSGFSGGRF